MVSYGRWWGRQEDEGVFRLPFGNGRHAPVAGVDQAYVAEAGLTAAHAAITAGPPGACRYSGSSGLAGSSPLHLADTPTAR